MPISARLLHFSSSPSSATNKWHLNHPTRKGMPIDIATLSAEPIESLAHKKTYRAGILEAVTDVVGEGGIMEGWKVQSIGQGYKDALDAQNAVVIVVKEIDEEEAGKKKLVAAELGHETSMKKKKKLAEEKDWVRMPSLSKKPVNGPIYTPTFSPVADLTHSSYMITSPVSPTYDTESPETLVREML